jgi:hypothetical protein
VADDIFSHLYTHNNGTKAILSHRSMPKLLLRLVRDHIAVVSME